MAEQRTSSSNNDHLLRDQVVDITSSVNNNNYTNRDNDDDSPQNNRDGQQPPMSRSNVLIGILSQITLAITFVSLLYSKDDVAFIKKNMWTALILGCFVHILCNFVFYKSVIVPASNSPSYLALKTKLCDDNYDEENNVADNEDRATRRVHHRSYASWDISFSSVVTFFLLVNVVVLYVLYQVFDIVFGDLDGPIVLWAYSVIYCCCLIFLDKVRLGLN